MCNYCGSAGMINTNPGDESLGFLSELLNTEFCPYCTKGRGMKKDFEERMARPGVTQRTLSREEAYAALGIKI